MSAGVAGNSVLLFCDSDSQVFSGIEYARAFGERGWTTTFAIPTSVRLAANAQSLIDSVDAPVVQAERHALAYFALEKSFTAVGIMTSGSNVKAACQDIRTLARLLNLPRPIIFTAFNGLVFEKFEEGLFWRLECDIVGLNGPRDKTLFDQFMLGREAEAPKIVITGLHRGKPGVRRERERPKMVFCEQIIVPGTKGDRNHLFSLLSTIANANPGWDIVVKPRVAQGEKSFHAQIFHPASYFAKREIPNLVVSYEPLDKQLSDAALVGTISSTAVFDGLNHGVPFFAIGNFGVLNRYGTHVFVPSGVMVSLKPDHSLDELLALQVSPTWLDWVGYSPDFTYGALIDAVEELVQQQLPDRPVALAELRHTTVLLQRTNKDILAAKLQTVEATREVGALVDYAIAAARDRAHQKAIHALEMAHVSTPGLPSMIRMLTGILVEAGQKERALEVVRAGLALSPKNYSFQILEERLTGRRRPAHERLMRYLHITARKSKWLKR